MIKPGLLAIVAPTAVGVIFRAVGNTGLTPDSMAGARAAVLIPYVCHSDWSPHGTISQQHGGRMGQRKEVGRDGYVR